ncbi:unnamed protein product [Protopolystoma xenopodis]|uniref:Secreted protein n=1 Tax=Protopolystoma xenopodis TaxID=117903 RepID=A0A448WFN8_9PLAT|nr:unnamed protein product [Protopolystoma xenopodis]
MCSGSLGLSVLLLNIMLDKSSSCLTSPYHPGRPVGRANCPDVVHDRLFQLMLFVCQVTYSVCQCQKAYFEIRPKSVPEAWLAQASTL